MEERICQFINKLLRIKWLILLVQIQGSNGIILSYLLLSSIGHVMSQQLASPRVILFVKKKTCEYLCIKKIFHLTCCHYAFLAFIQYLQFQLHQWNLSVSVCVCICVCEIKLCYFTSWDLGQVYCLNCYIIITMLLSRLNVLKFSCTIYVFMRKKCVLQGSSNVLMFKRKFLFFCYP